MITCIIIEDQEPAQALLHRYINKSGKLKLMATFSNAIEGMAYLKENNVELVFLDIHLPKMSGIDFLKVVHNQPFVILTTAFANYALQSYDFDVVDYLLKPFSFERFEIAMHKVYARKATQTSSAPIVVKDGFDIIQIDPQQILFIKAEGDYTQVVMKEKKHLLLYPLKHWLGKLPSKQFHQIHKSYIVNINRVDKISKNQVSISCNLLPIGRVYKNDFLSHFERIYKQES